MPVLTGSDIGIGVVGSYARDAVIGVTEFATRALGGGAAPAPAADQRDAAALSPADLLFDLRVPEPVRSWLTPPADALGLKLEDGKARGKYGGRRDRLVTYLTDGADVRRTLLYIDKRVLKDPKAHDALGMVAFALEKNEYVSVFGEDVELPVPVIANLIDGLWKEWVNSRFVGWPFVLELPTLEPVDQIAFLHTHVWLDGYKPRPQGTTAASGPGKVSSEDIVRIVSILSALGYDDARARRTLLLEADLRDFAGTIDLVGPTNDVGSELILKLTQYRGPVPSGQRTAIGAFLVTIMGLQDVRPDDAGWLKVLITRLEL
jgi:effector-associated domain 8 (EAD8)-containing protein